MVTTLLALLWFARAVQLARDEPELQELNRIRMSNWRRLVCLPEGSCTLPKFRQHQDRFRIFQFSPDGKYLLVVGTTEDSLVWDCRQDRRVPLSAPLPKGVAAAWEPKKGFLAVTREKGQIQLLAPPSFQPVEDVTAAGEVAVLAFSRDGKRLAWGASEGARVWDRSKKEYSSPLLAHTSPVTTLSFSASGELLATSDRDKARVFRIGSEKGEPLFPPVPHTRPEHGLAHGGPDRVAPRFAADDQVLLTVESIEHGVHQLVWRSATSGKVLPSSKPLPGQGFLTAFAVSSGGDRVAAMWEDNGQLWDAQTKRLLGANGMRARFNFDVLTRLAAEDKLPPTISTGANWCEDVVFSADGKTLITCGHNMRTQFWSVEDRQNGPLTASSPPVVHPMKVVRAILSPDGEHLAAALWDGTVYLWRMPEGPPPTYSAPAGGITRPVLSPDKRFVLPGGTTYRNGTQLDTRVYQADTGKAKGPVLDPGGILLNAVFSPDGTRVATASSTAQTAVERNRRLFEPDGKAGNVQLWDWRTGKRLVGPIATPTEPRGLAFRPDGRALAVVCADYRVVLVDPDTGTIAHTLDSGIHTRPGNANLWRGNGEARFSPDGRFLVTWEMAAPVHVWNPETGKLLHTLSHNERVESVAFSPVASTLLATGGRDSVARVWNLASGRLLAQLQHPAQLSRVQFSPEGTELITSCTDGMLRALGLADGQTEGWVGSAPHRRPRFWLLRGSPLAAHPRSGGLATDRLADQDFGQPSVASWEAFPPRAGHSGRRSPGGCRRFFRLSERLRPEGDDESGKRNTGGTDPVRGTGGRPPHPEPGQRCSADKRRVGSAVATAPAGQSFASAPKAGVKGRPIELVFVDRALPPAHFRYHGKHFWPVCLTAPVYVGRQLGAVHEGPVNWVSGVMKGGQRFPRRWLTWRGASHG